MRPCHLLLPLLIAAAAQAQPLAGLYGVELDGTPWGPVAEAAAAALTDAGYAVERLPEDSFAHGALEGLSRFAVLALPHAGRPVAGDYRCKPVPWPAAGCLSR